MKITEDVWKYVGGTKRFRRRGVELGMQEKRKEFVEKGAEVYTKA
jgi:hypothetical protein